MMKNCIKQEMNRSTDKNLLITSQNGTIHAKAFKKIDLGEMRVVLTIAKFAKNLTKSCAWHQWFLRRSRESSRGIFSLAFLEIKSLKPLDHGRVRLSKSVEWLFQIPMNMLNGIIKLQFTSALILLTA